MDIIPGIFSDTSFADLPYDKTVEVIEAFKPLITAETAAFINHYIKSPGANATMVKALNEVLGKDLENYVYMASLRNNKINEKVTNYNLYEVPYYYRKGQFCGFPIDEGMKIVKDLIDHKGIIKAVDNLGTSEEWNNFFDVIKSKFHSDDFIRIMVNRDHLYRPHAKPHSTYLSSIVSKIEQLEMGYMGILYMQHAWQAGISNEGSTLF